ncbi:MAG: hypothetical protein A2504_00350 [Bdellovibrionales bacterium RIFOXYD12_FULL_39_22]|nr:MAG: hypothetical protein A2385_13930 [Bdellovibrionales bacterium RIFOXYB1_FULL_39_21]OFZ42431.1 MAG: hypothetical protein A2485_03980 [Bdellovibrionales bacterium RIFOXYC12_FULL_39_17]OFZ45407.1 MAG: hypothetical protein A2404_01420 [Bdellovibrionales bacterium RIFOXYC1_FULL_39_130]OFZ68433.1 MAG: hypothetical protein A2451_01625 [Bdellovibrionales bacterium RIFOXYC2_FULL_39_8]OFZ74604.1 MAG: hypothetical protein A2560_09450 [Bdellovibrionales bacterium RIFOXYD1_FULL_39_84]OFZ92886.1 MAG:
MRLKNTLIDVVVWFFCFGFASIGFTVLHPQNAYAFDKLKNGFEMMTNNYLLPLSQAVGGFFFILYIILSYFRQDEYLRKVSTVAMLGIFSAAGISLMDTLTKSFS